MDAMMMGLIGGAVLLFFTAFIGFLTRRGFFVFGIYRIIVGGLILLFLLTGHHLEMM